MKTALTRAGRYGGRTVADLLAFLAVLMLAGALVLMIDRTGQMSTRLAFAGAAGLVAACVNAWRRLHRVPLRRWRSGQLTYRGPRVTLVSAWGVEGQPAPAVEPASGTSTAVPAMPTAPASTSPEAARLFRRRSPTPPPSALSEVTVRRLAYGCR